MTETLSDFAHALAKKQLYYGNSDDPHSLVDVVRARNAPAGSVVSHANSTLASCVENNPVSESGAEPHLRCIRAADVTVKRIEWFMQDRIPRNELTLFDGDGGIGKTTVVLDTIARATAGEALPDGSWADERPKVLILAEEDSFIHA